MTAQTLNLASEPASCIDLLRGTITARGGRVFRFSSVDFRVRVEVPWRPGDVVQFRDASGAVAWCNAEAASRDAIEAARAGCITAEMAMRSVLRFEA